MPDDIQSLANLIRMDAEAQQREKLSRLGRALSVEYRDFMSAIDDPMTIDLGENMRLQLKEVFRILEKHGIKLS